MTVRELIQGLLLNLHLEDKLVFTAKDGYDSYNLEIQGIDSDKDEKGEIIFRVRRL